MPKVNKFLSTETMYNENMENDSNSVYSKLVIFMTFLIGTISLIMSLTILTTLSSLGFSIIYSMGCKLQVFFDNLEIIVSHLNIALSKLDYIRLSFKKSQAKIFRQNISASSFSIKEPKGHNPKTSQSINISCRNQNKNKIERQNDNSFDRQGMTGKNVCRPNSHSPVVAPPSFYEKSIDSDSQIYKYSKEKEKRTERETNKPEESKWKKYHKSCRNCVEKIIFIDK